MDSQYNHKEAEKILECLGTEANSAPAQNQLATLLSAQPSWEQTYKIKRYENPVLWRLVREAGVEKELEEAVFTLQGVLVEKELPPLKEKSRIPVVKYKYLRQAVSITGLNTLIFAWAITAAQEVYGKFYRQFTDGTLLSWATSDLDQGESACLDIANRYFTPKRGTRGLPNVSFQKEVDPYGVLVNMAAGDAVHSYIHTDDNQVQYFTTFKGVGGERKQVQRYPVQFESCGPQLFRIGNIVQVQLSFVAIPVRGNNYKMLVVLCSMALLDGTLRKTNCSAPSTNLLIDKPRTLKRRVGYNDGQDDHEQSQAAKHLRQMAIDPAE